MTTIERLIDNCDLRCAICGAKREDCGCWQKCSCGWSYLFGEACGNPTSTNCLSKKDDPRAWIVEVINTETLEEKHYGPYSNVESASIVCEIKKRLNCHEQVGRLPLVKWED